MEKPSPAIRKRLNRWLPKLEVVTTFRVFTHMQNCIMSRLGDFLPPGTFEVACQMFTQLVFLGFSNSLSPLCIWRHNYIANGPISTKFGVPHADDSEKADIETGSRISIWRPLVLLQIAISGRNLVCLLNQSDSGSRFATLWPPCSKINMTS